MDGRKSKFTTFKKTFNNDNNLCILSFPIMVVQFSSDVLFLLRMEFAAFLETS